MNAIVQHSPQQGLIPRNMPEAMQLAEVMARGKMMPLHLQNLGDALMVIEQAMRWNMSPFAVAQNTFNIKGKLLYAGVVVHAAVESIGISGLVNYTFDGEGLMRKITVTATRKGETEPKTVEVVLKDAMTDNPLWKKQPDQQLCYHAVRVWARRWTPGVLLGVYTPEEWREQPQGAFAGPTIDAEPASRILTTGDVISDEIPDRVMEWKPKGRTARQYLDSLHATLAACQNEWEVDAVAQSEDVVKAAATFTGLPLTELNALLAEALERVREPEGRADEPAVDDGFPGDKP